MNEKTSIWVPDGSDAGDLIRLASVAVNASADLISAPSESLHMLWSWLENKPVKIYCREQFNEISNLSMRAASDFKRGADGIQVFVKNGDLNKFVSEILMIKDDLFFGKKLSIAMNLDEIGPFDMDDIFYNLNKVGADNLLLYWPTSPKKNKQFIGQIYGLFDSFDQSCVASLHFYTPNQLSEVVMRLAEKIQPSIIEKIVFFK